jgi:hypothetical protein
LKNVDDFGEAEEDILDLINAEFLDEIEDYAK